MVVSGRKDMRFHGFPTGRQMVAMAAALTLLAGCAGTTANQSGHTASFPMSQTGRRIEKETETPAERERLLRRAAERWQGTAHRMGGTGSRGMDCSGLALRIFSDLFRIELPRTSREQAAAGRPVAKNALRPGDLVFFRIPEKKIRHVGVYLGHGEFVHASTSRGVTVSALDNPYWEKAYRTARRVF